jgi:hypothetical protein
MMDSTLKMDPLLKLAAWLGGRLEWMMSKMLGWFQVYQEAMETTMKTGHEQIRTEIKVWKE